jgi:hypothetical protein
MFRGENMKVLLDGSKMRAKMFYRRFRNIVGVSYKWWIKKKSIVSSSGSEWYEYRDEQFVLGGDAYNPPRLFRIATQKKAR